MDQSCFDWLPVGRKQSRRSTECQQIPGPVRTSSTYLPMSHIYHVSVPWIYPKQTVSLLLWLISVITETFKPGLNNNNTQFKII